MSKNVWRESGEFVLQKSGLYTRRIWTSFEHSYAGMEDDEKKMLVLD